MIMAAAGRRRSAGRQHSVEDQALNLIAREGEEKLAQRKAQREEARIIRGREMERRQKEMEEKQDRLYELTKDSNSRSFNHSKKLDIEEPSADYEEFVDCAEACSSSRAYGILKEKYEKAMLINAQLENEKQTYRYQADLLKDSLEELEESHFEANRLLRDRYRDLELKRRDCDDIQLECDYYKIQIEQRDKLIQEYNLVFISNDTTEEQQMTTAEDKRKRRRRKKEEGKEEKTPAALVTKDAMQILSKVQGNLDEKIKKLQLDRDNLEAEVRILTNKLDKEREKSELAEKYAREGSSSRTTNGPVNDTEATELNTEAQKQLTEYRYKLKKAEQDITVLEGNVLRLENQVKRYKTASEEAEALLEEMKSDKRKMQKEIRDTQNKVEELESQNSHLQKRLEKLKKDRLDAIVGK